MEAAPEFIRGRSASALRKTSRLISRRFSAEHQQRRFRRDGHDTTLSSISIPLNTCMSSARLPKLFVHFKPRFSSLTTGHQPVNMTIDRKLTPSTPQVNLFPSNCVKHAKISAPPKEAQ